MLKIPLKKKLPDYLPKTKGVIDVPVELLNEFILNAPKALRDLASIPTDAITPFYGNLNDKFGRFLLSAYNNPFDSVTRQFSEDFRCSFDDRRPRFLHIDIGIKKDAAGIAMSSVIGMQDVERFDLKRKVTEIVKLPKVHFDFTGRLVAPDDGEIEISSLREIIIKLRDDLGFNIELVTFDRYQSTDTIQILRDLGFVVEHLSIDRTAFVIKVNYDKKNFIERISTDKQYATPHEMLRAAIYDNRVTIPRVRPRIESIFDNERDWSEEIEFNSQEFDSIKNTVFKSQFGWDDWLQAVAGSFCNAVVNNLNYEEHRDEDLMDDDFDPYDIEDPYENYNVGII